MSQIIINGQPLYQVDLPEMTLAEWLALPVAERPKEWIRTDGSPCLYYENDMMPASYPASRVSLTNGSSVEDIIGKASGSGLANSIVYREEITSITAEMWANIADGSFKGLHAGMHYTAPSGRTYYFADADYYIGKGDTEQTAHHMLVIEDEINHTAQHQTTNVTTGGATSSLIYTTTLPGMQGELETDFGAAHIKTQRIYLSNATSGGIASGGAWASKSAALLNLNQIFGHSLGYTEGSGQYFNALVRERQLSLFQAMPETIVARTAGTTTRQHYWCDDVISASSFGSVRYGGNAGNDSASDVYGVRRAFLIG